MNHLQHLAKARVIAMYKAPYFSVGIHALIPEAVPGVKTLGVTKDLVLYYDPAYLESIDEEDLAHDLIHEVLHVLHRHKDREEQMGVGATNGHKLFNLAADLAINSLMETMGIRVSKGVYPRDYGFPQHKTTEEYWELLKSQSEQQQQKMLDDAAAKSEKPSSKGAEEDCPGKDGIGNGGCGGVAGNPQDKELEDRLDAELGRHQSEQNIIQDQMQQELQAAIGRGTAPSQLQQCVRLSNRTAKIPWQQVLRQLVRKLMGQIEGGGDDFSIAFPSKRSYVRGIIRPGMIEQKMFPAFILDTSGSMGTEEIESAITETIDIVRNVGCSDAWFVQADTKVACAPRRVSLRDLKGEINIHGRGGTNFDAALKATDSLKPKPDIIFYLTDGDGGVSYVPKTPVVWVIVNNYVKTPPTPWGKTVFVERERQ